MKRTLATLLMAFGLGSMFIATPLSAQSNTAVADVPFPFVVAGHSLPAGQYRVSQFSGNAPVFTITNKAAGSIFAQLGLYQPVRSPDASLTFMSYEGTMNLVKITPPDSLVAYAFLPQKGKQRRLPIAAMVNIKLR